MLTKRIIPCLDVKDGWVVKGMSFVNLRDTGDPVEVAAIYDQEGADELCFLDITASHENRKTLLDVVTRTAERVFMPLTVGGGVTAHLKIFGHCSMRVRTKSASIQQRFRRQTSSKLQPSVWNPMHCRCHRCKTFAGPFRRRRRCADGEMANLYARRSSTDGCVCHRVGASDGIIWCWRDSSHQHGSG